jgi:hypothetical protein
MYSSIQRDRDLEHICKHNHNFTESMKLNVPGLAMVTATDNFRPVITTQILVVISGESKVEFWGRPSKKILLT